jgi:hypothetical protein
MKKKLEGVTLLGIDCVDIDRLILAAEICIKDFEFKEVKLLTSLKSDNKYIVPIDKINSTEEYSKFVITELYKYVNTEHVLVIQYDGFILNPNAWEEEFLKYDYIGSPWLFKEWAQKLNIPKELLGTMMVGNGGFSLRSKKLLSLTAELAQEGMFKSYDPEDLAICFWNRELLESKGIIFAPVETGKRFGFEGETDVSDKWNGQLGFHGFRWTDISNWIKDHPEYILDREANTFNKTQEL